MNKQQFIEWINRMIESVSETAPAPGSVAQMCALQAVMEKAFELTDSQSTSDLRQLVEDQRREIDRLNNDRSRLYEQLKRLLLMVIPESACNIRPHESTCGCYSCQTFEAVESARAILAAHETKAVTIKDEAMFKEGQ